MANIRIYKMISFRAVILTAGLLISVLSAKAQEENPKAINFISGGATATNNGISLLPTFSLGKPALIFDLATGNNRLSFEPQLRFSMEGRPWVFLFWWRYKFVQSEKFKLTAGVHPAFVFNDIPAAATGVPQDAQIAKTYLAGDFAPNYFIRKNISVGIYYLHSSGFMQGAIKNTNFITVNANFTNIKLSDKFYAKFNPQLYYLRMDDLGGYYVTTTITLAKRDFPLSVQSIINQAIQTDLVAKHNFVWNLSLVYSFRKNFSLKPL
jgi:hypothetical protein